MKNVCTTFNLILFVLGAILLIVGEPKNALAATAVIIMNIFIATIQALDNESKNIFYGVYDTQVDNRLTMFPWDLDISLGANIMPELNQPDIVSPERPVNWIGLLPMAGMMDIKSYRDEVEQRYRELRETVLNTDSLVNRFRTVIDNLEACGAATREENRWSKDSDIARKVLDLSKEMDYVEDWIRRRMVYLDEHFPRPVIEYPEGDVNLDFEVNIADVNALIDIIMGGVDNSMGQSDVNHDGEVNLADINRDLELILNPVNPENPE